MKLNLLAITLLTASLLTATPQSQFPDTPAAHQFSAWLEAFNSGDRAKLLEFLQNNNPSRAGNIDGEMAFRRMTGGFEFKKAEESTATRFTGIVKERDSDTFARFAVEVEAAEPHHIKSLDLRQIPIPAEFVLPRMSQDDAIAALRAELGKHAAADSFSGAVLIAKDGKPVFKAAYGLADREKKTPNQLDTQFRIGSMNKMFTAVSVLQLVQAGKIKLTDPLGKYLTDYPNKGLGFESDNPSIADAHRGDRRFLRPGVRQTPAGAAHVAGLYEALRPARRGIRAGEQMGVQQLRIFALRRVGREG